MTIRKILTYPENKEELRRPSEPVRKMNRQVRQYIRDLKETLEASDDGIGLAAPQVDIHQRLVIVCLGSETEGQWKAGPPRALVNPEIILEEDGRKDFDGCLSFPGLFGVTERPHRIRVTGMNEDGKNFDEVIEGFNAVIVHHEVDHLDGVLFIDRVASPEDLYTIQRNEKGEPVKAPLQITLPSDKP